MKTDAIIGFFVGLIRLNDETTAELYLEDDSPQAVQDASQLAQDIQIMLEKQRTLTETGE